MKLMKKWGSGIPRVLKEVCDEGLDSPVFEGGEVDFVVNIYRKGILSGTDTVATNETNYATDTTALATETTIFATYDTIYQGSETKKATDKTGYATSATKLKTCIDELTNDEIKVIDVVRDNPTITQQELLEITGISMGTIKRIMPRLQKKGVLIREGNRRAGQWKVIE